MDKDSRINKKRPAPAIPADGATAATGGEQDVFAKQEDLFAADSTD